MASLITCSMFASIMLMWVFSCTLCSSLDASISYEEYCHDTLTDAEEELHPHGISPTSISSNFFLSFQTAFFSGGFPLFDTNFSTFSLRSWENSASFSASSVQLPGEQEAQKHVIEGSLLLRSRSRFAVFPQPGARRADPFIQPEGIRLALKGLWVASSGTLCMSGCFVQNVLGRSKKIDDCRVKAVFRYPLKNSISQPLVKGVMESKRERQDPLFFEPVAITGVPEAPYVFRKDDENAENCPLQHANVPDDIKIWNDETAVCQWGSHRQQPLTVVWDKQCTVHDCSPFVDVIPGSRTTLSVENMVCAAGKVHGFFTFSHRANTPETEYGVFAVEGAWNTSTGQLCASACYLKGAANGSLAFESKDCDILITLQFPTTFSLVFRYSVVGRVEREKNSKFPSFKPFSLVDSNYGSFGWEVDSNYGSFGWEMSRPQMEYAYTKERIMQAHNHCKASSPEHSKKGLMGKGKPRYPDGQDVSFEATVKDFSGSSVEAYFSVVRTRTHRFFSRSMENSKSMNISFNVNFDVYENQKGIKLLDNTTLFEQFPAEGVYNADTGMLCLIACRPLTLSKAHNGSKLYDGNKDCEMLVTLQYPPINFGKHKISGQVKSLRDPKDDLFFPPASVSSTSFFSREQGANILVQINLEVMMEIISLTMAVLFIGLQLHHVKKNPKVLSHMSLLMLTLLTLGHLIPLVLKLEEIFSSRDILQWRDGWLEINEVIVGLMTMLVFLMLIRLLYLSWVSKSEASGPWHMERGALCVCLTLYAFGGLIALVVYGVKVNNFLDAMKAFAGLTIDFFLFPQVIGNYFWEIQGMVLSCPFYVGMTLVRSLPHLYDILRGLEFFSLSNRRRKYVYANPSWDFYSNAWDAIIPFGNLLLAVLVFYQQRCGGACFSMGFWRKTRAIYSKVSMNAI